jgi:O-methyltransferase
MMELIKKSVRHLEQHGLRSFWDVATNYLHNQLHVAFETALDLAGYAVVSKHNPKLNALTNGREESREIYERSPYVPWKDDTEFQACFETVAARTMMQDHKLYELWHIAQQVETESVDGDVLEVGSWRGGSGGVIAKKLDCVGSSKSVFLCDTFEGVVKTNQYDNYQGGEHADTSKEIVEETVEETIETLDLDTVEVEILNGIFPDETGASVSDRQFSYCHIDTDTYDSARDVIEWVWGRLAENGVIIFDDYGVRGTEGITKIVNDLSRRGDALLLHYTVGQAVTVKTGH